MIVHPDIKDPLLPSVEKDVMFDARYVIENTPKRVSTTGVMALLIAVQTDLAIGLRGCGKSLAEHAACAISEKVDGLHQWRWGDVEIYAKRWWPERKPDIVFSVHDGFRPTIVGGTR